MNLPHAKMEPNDISNLVETQPATYVADPNSLPGHATRQNYDTTAVAVILIAALALTLCPKRVTDYVVRMYHKIAGR